MTYIAMNRFKVAAKNGEAFEEVWRNRDSYLARMKGFVEFHLLRGPETDGYRLYSSHTVWATTADFHAWTESEEFRAAHARAGNANKLFEGHPQFEGFEVVQTLVPARQAAE